jgi:hypothetical protein
LIITLKRILKMFLENNLKLSRDFHHPSCIKKMKKKAKYYNVKYHDGWYLAPQISVQIPPRWYPLEFIFDIQVDICPTLVSPSNSWKTCAMSYWCALHGTLHKPHNANFRCIEFTSKIKTLLAFMFNYFIHNLKQHFEFSKLVELLQYKGNKILKNIKTQWISMFFP